MKVKALTDGFFGGARRRAGQIFEVPNGTKGKWFEPVKASEPAVEDKPAKKKGDKSTPETLSELAKSATPQELEVI